MGKENWRKEKINKWINKLRWGWPKKNGRREIINKWINKWGEDAKKWDKKKKDKKIGEKKIFWVLSGSCDPQK